jgi:DNA repair exonuclease SbcCD ATPase subunit
MKCKVNITLDTQIREEAKVYQLNISEISQQAIESIINMKKGDIHAGSEAILKHKLKKLENKQVTINSEITELRMQLKKIAELQEQAEEERLSKERETLEQSKKCKGCGNVYEEGHKWHVMPIGNICHSCFMSARREDYNKWNKK